MKMNKLKTFLSVLLALVMALMLGAAAFAEPEGTAPAAQEKAANREITYVGGVVLRSNVKDDDTSLLEIACVLANQPYVLLAQPSLWDVQVQGGTAPYTVEADICYRSFDSTDTSNSWPISESFTLSDLLFEHTFTEAGRYFWQFTVTDAAGQTLIFQTRVFETYTEADEADATTVAGKVNSVVSQLISDGMSDYRRALVLHDWLIDNADYDQTYTYYEAAGVLLYGTGVCDSYARAYQMLLAAAGVESMIVTGSAGSDESGWEAHGWNLVKLGDAWYHIDCTWDDPVGGEENHAYFCLTDEELSADHKWNRPGTSVDSGMLVPDAEGGVYSDVEASTDYDFTFSDIASFEAGLDAQVAAQAYTPVIAVYTQGNVSDIQDDLFSSLSAKLQEYANQGLLSGETSYTISGSTIKLTLPWLTESSYVRIDETEILLYAGETVTVSPAVLSPADAQLTWSVSDPAVLAVSGSSSATVTALAEGSATLIATAPSGLTDEISVTVKPAWQSNFSVQMTEMEDGTFVFAWDAVPGATEYALIAVSGGTETQVAFTEACTLTVENASVSNAVCDSLYVAARRVLFGETVLTHTSATLTPPESSLEIELSLIKHFDVVYTGGSYQPVVFRLEITNYDELAAKYGSLMTEFYIESSADESLGSYGYIFSDARGAHAALLVQPTATGDLTLTATAQFGDLTKSVEFPITVADPATLTVSYPERIDVKAGDDFTHVLTFNGEACPWLASHSIGFNQTLISAPDSQSPAAYAFTALESGISHLNLSVYYSNLPVETNAIVFIADSEGNVPELKPEILLESHSTDLYIDSSFATWELGIASLSNYSFFCETVPDFTAPVWTVSSDVDSFPVFCNGDNSWVAVTTRPNELTQTGSVNITLTCTIGQEGDLAYCTDSIVIPVTVSESPVTDPSVLLPASVNAQVGQAFTLDAMAALPADWSGVTPQLQLLSSTDCFELDTDGSGVYICTPLQPGVYDVSFCWQLANQMHYPNVQIFVTDENGNLPGIEFSTWENIQCGALFTNGSCPTYMICTGISNLQEFTNLFGVDHVNFALSSDSDESLGVYELTSIDSGSVYIINSALPTTTGSVTLTLTISVGEESDVFYQSTDLTYTIDIDEFDASLYSVTLPDRVEGQVGEELLLTPSVTCPEGETWSIGGASLEKGEILDFGGTSSDGLSYRFNPLTRGITSAGVSVSFRNVYCDASTLAFIADETGDLPSLEMDMTIYPACNPMYVRDDTFQSFVSAHITNLAELQALTGNSSDPSWSISIAEGAPDIVVTNNGDYAVFGVSDCDLTAGSWDAVITATLGYEGSAYYITKSLPVTFVVEPDPRVETSHVPDRIDVQVGETFTLSKLGRLPEGWCGSQNPFIELTNHTDVFEFVSQTDTEATFRALSSGLWTLDVFWQMSNLTDGFEVDVYIADENGVVPGTFVSVFPSFDTSDFMYLGGSTYIGNCRIDNYSDLTALYGGEPQWSVTSLDGVSVTSYGSGRYFSLELSEMPSAAASADFRVDCVWGEATWSSDFHLELRAHADGLPTDLDVQDAYYLTLDESLALDPAALVLPAGFDLTEASPRINLAWDSDLPLGGFSDAFSYQFEDGGVLRVTPVKQDICKVSCIWQYKNLSVTRDVLLYSANESGEFISLEPDMRADAPDVQLFYLGGNHQTCNGISIMNADALSAYASGEPQWTITQLSGEEGLLGGTGTGTYLQVDLLGSAEQTGDNVYRVDMVWGDISWSKEFTLRFTELEAGLPTLSLPASITVMAGETASIDALDIVSPQGWSSGDDCTPSLYLWNNSTFIDSCQDYEEGGSVLTLTPTVPGIYPVSLIWAQQNISLGGDFTVIVTDENGELPSVAPVLTQSSRNDLLLANGNFETFPFGSVRVSNWSELSAMFGDDVEAVWTITASEGGPEFQTQISDGLVYAHAIGDTLQPGEYDVTFAFTVSDPVLAPYCSGSITLDMTVRENPQSDTDYAGIPAVIEAQVGQTFSISKLTTMDADWDGAAPWMAITSGAENFTLISESDSEIVYQPLASGLFTVDIDWQLANMLACRTVSIRVADENGVVPMPEIDMNVMYDDDTVFIVGGDDGGNINSHRIDNYDELSQVLSGTPVWTVTAVESCTDDQLQIAEMYTGTSAVWLSPHPTQACTVRYKVTCTWDGAVWEGESTLTFIEVESMPTGIDMPAQIILDPGESFTYYPTDVLPADWADDRLSPEAVISVGHYNSSYWDYFSTSYSNNAITLTGSTPGVYPMLLRWHLPNFSLEQDVTIVIRNTDGTLPFPTFSVDTLGSLCEFYQDGNTLDLFDIIVSDYFDKQSLITGDISWSIEQISGPATIGASGSFIVHDAEAWPPTCYDVSLDTWPTVQGEYVYRVTAEWGECIREVDLTVNVHGNLTDTPIEGIGVEDVTIKVGETISIPMEPIPLLPEGADLPIDGASNQFMMSSGFVNAFTHTGYDGGSILYQANQTGVYKYYLKRWGGNFLFEKTVTVTVTDENGDLPMPDITLGSYVTQPQYAGGNALFLASVYPMDSGVMEQFAAMTEEDPVWTVETLTGDVDAVVYPYYDLMGATLEFAAAPTEGEHSYRVTLSWAGETFTHDVSVTVLAAPETIPTGLSMPYGIGLTAGEEVTFLKSQAFAPMGWCIEGESIFLTIWDDEANSGHLNVTMTSDLLTFSFDEPGVYNCTWYAACANYYQRQNVTVFVTDENGDIPGDLTMTTNASEDLYAGGNELDACSAYLWESEAEEYAATTEAEPQWSFSVLSGPHTFNGRFLDGYPYSFILDFTEPPVEGTSVVRIILEWGDLYQAKQVTVTVNPGPDSAPTGLNFPDEVTVMVNETLTVTYDNPFLPEDWGIEGQSFFANLWEIGEGSGHMTRVSVTEANTFAYVFDEPGVYECEWFARCGNYTMKKPVTVKVTDENGNLPADGLLLNNYLRSRMYIEGMSRQIGNIQFDSECYDSLSATLGGAPTYELVESSHALNLYDFGGFGCGLFLTSMPAEPCTITYTIRVTWGDLTEDIAGSTEVVNVMNGMPDPLNIPDYLRLAPGEVYTFNLEDVMMPSDWSTGYDDEFFFGIGATSDVWQYVNSDILSDTSRTVSSNTPGIYEVDVFYEAANITVSKSVLLCIEDSDGSLWMPEGSFSLTNTEVTWYRGGNNLILCDAVFDEDVYDLWLQMDPAGPQWFDTVDVYPTETPYRYLIAIKDPDIEAGDYSLEVGFTWDEMGMSVEVWLIVEDPGVTLPEALNIPDVLAVTTGEDFSIQTAELLPDGWAINGENGWIEVTIINEEESGLTRTDTTEDAASFHADSAGTWDAQIRWVCENFFLLQNFVIQVSDPVLNVTAQQAEYKLLPGMCVQTVLTGDTALIAKAAWNTSDAGVAEVDANGAITALSAGTTTITASLIGSNGAACELTFPIEVLSGEGTMTLPAALTTIVDNAFDGTAAQVILVPDRVTAIGDSAFASSENLLLVRIPASVTQIGNDILTGTDAAILCESGSEAESYALTNGIPCYIIK